MLHCQGFEVRHALLTAPYGFGFIDLKNAVGKSLIASAFARCDSENIQQLETAAQRL
jgi:hypothetical protein